MNAPQSTVTTETPDKADVHTGGSMFRIPRAPLGRKPGEKQIKAD